MSSSQAASLFDDEELDAAFFRGIGAGVDRVNSTGTYAESGPVRESVIAMANKVSDLDGELQPHAVELLSELTAIAVAVRNAHGEEPLTPSDLEDFLPQAVKFFNTYIGCANPG